MLWVGVTAAGVGCTGADVGCAATVGALCVTRGGAVGAAAVGAALGVGAWQAASKAMPAAEPNMRSAVRRLTVAALASERVNVPVLPTSGLKAMRRSTARHIPGAYAGDRWPMVTVS